MFKKFVTGFVIQNYDTNGKCTSQEFVAGDEVEWEDSNGEPISTPPHQYQPFNMVQPCPNTITPEEAEDFANKTE
jgi:hypothetical protein